MAPFVDMRGLSLRRGETRILQPIDLSIARGEFVAIIGPSGAGKTSLLRCINTLVPDFGGTIMLDGTNVRTLPPERLRRGIGYVLQNIGLFPHMTVAENIGLPARIRGERQHDPARVAELLSMMELPQELSRRYPSSLSGGQAQRVAIARAVIGRPDMLVADEPTGNVDPEMALKLIRLFEALNRLGTTVVVATHDVHLLSKVPDSLIMRLDKGVLSDPTGALRYPPRRIGAGE